LADASVLVRTLEFDELIDVRAHFAAQHAGVIGLDAHDDALGVNLVDDTFALTQHDRAGIARGDTFHARATSGASPRMSGTAWRCMFEPINARLASSFSRNG